MRFVAIRFTHVFTLFRLPASVRSKVLVRLEQLPVFTIREYLQQSTRQISRCQVGFHQISSSCTLFISQSDWNQISLCSVFRQLLVGATVQRCERRESFDFIINQTFHFNLYLIHRIILIKLRQCRISLYHWMQCLHVHVTAACTCNRYMAEFITDTA